MTTLRFDIRKVEMYFIMQKNFFEQSKVQVYHYPENPNPNVATLENSLESNAKFFEKE